MTNGFTGLLALLVYVGWVAGSVPLALALYGLARWLGSVDLALGYVGAVVVGVVLAAFPLYIGRQLLERWTSLAPDRALVFAVLGWPVALLASLVVFVAPGGPTRYNITFLSGPVAALAWTVVGLVVTLGPGVVGYAAYRLVDREA